MPFMPSFFLLSHPMPANHPQPVKLQDSAPILMSEAVTSQALRTSPFPAPRPEKLREPAQIRHNLLPPVKPRSAATCSLRLEPKFPRPTKPRSAGPRHLLPQIRRCCDLLPQLRLRLRTKGVVLTHENISAFVRGMDIFMEQFEDKMTVDDVYLSFLPLAHILDRTIEEYFFHKGASVGYYHGLSRLLERLIPRMSFMGLCKATNYFMMPLTNVSLGKDLMVKSLVSSKLHVTVLGLL